MRWTGELEKNEVSLAEPVSTKIKSVATAPWEATRVSVAGYREAIVELSQSCL